MIFQQKSFAVWKMENRINVNLVKDSSGAGNLYRLLVFNLGTVGSIAALIAFAQSMFKERHFGWPLLVVSVICFIVALVVSTWI